MRPYFKFTISLLVLLNSDIFGSPSFDCKRATTKIERVICENPLLCDLDCALNVVYNKALVLSSNSSEIRREQLAWMIKRRAEYGALVDTYTERLLQLLNNHKLRNFYLKKFIEEHLSIEPIIFYLAAISLWEETSKEIDWYDLIDQLILGSKHIPINKHEILLALMTSQGAYRQSYSFFVLRREKEKIFIVPFSLPHPKSFKLQVEGKRGNTLTGNFAFSKTDKHMFIDYSSRPSSYEGGNHCTWQIDHSGVNINEG